jgi:hypothetical protein
MRLFDEHSYAVPTLSVVSHVFLDENRFQMTDFNPSPRRSLATGDFSGDALQVVVVHFLIFSIRIFVLVENSPATLTVGIAASSFGETIQDLADGDSYGIDRKRLGPLHLVHSRHSCENGFRVSVVMILYVCTFAPWKAVEGWWGNV